MTLQELIYSKQFPEPIHSDLLKIAGSRHWVEDMIDYIAEFGDDVQNYRDAVAIIEQDMKVEKTEVAMLEDRLKCIHGAFKKLTEQVRRKACVGGIEVDVD
jgi:hypothetical protein